MLTINWDLLGFYYHSVAVQFYYKNDREGIVSLAEVGFNFEFRRRILTSVWDALNFTFKSM